MARRGFEPIWIDESPGQFHARTFDAGERTLWIPILSPTPTLVLGSSQSVNTVDEDALKASGIDVASRRSGGGAVLVSSADLVWFDVVLPTDDPLWHHDVGRSFDWLGLAVQRALQSLDVATEMHSAPLQHSRWSRRICFAGLGPGELVHNGRKLVGMSQRRTRSASRLQVAILRRWDGEQHASFLDLQDGETHDEATAELMTAATGIPHDPKDIMQAIQIELTDL